MCHGGCQMGTSFLQSPTEPTTYTGSMTCWICAQVSDTIASQRRGLSTLAALCPISSRNHSMGGRGGAAYLFLEVTVFAAHHKNDGALLSAVSLRPQGAAL